MILNVLARHETQNKVSGLINNIEIGDRFFSYGIVFSFSCKIREVQDHTLWLSKYNVNRCRICLRRSILIIDDSDTFESGLYME